MKIVLIWVNLFLFLFLVLGWFVFCDIVIVGDRINIIGINEYFLEGREFVKVGK